MAKRLGSIACPAGCGCTDATASETDAGTLNVSCHRCGCSCYGKAGTKAKRLLAAKVVPDPDDEQPAGTPPAPSPAPAPAARTSNLIL